MNKIGKEGEMEKNGGAGALGTPGKIREKGRPGNDAVSGVRDDGPRRYFKLERGSASRGRKGAKSNFPFFSR
jgi:hypothetical protein